MFLSEHVAVNGAAIDDLTVRASFLESFYAKDLKIRWMENNKQIKDGVQRPLEGLPSNISILLPKVIESHNNIV